MAEKHEIQSWQIQLAQLKKAEHELWQELEELDAALKKKTQEMPEFKAHQSMIDKWYTVHLEVQSLDQKIRFALKQSEEKPSTMTTSTTLKT